MPVYWSMQDTQCMWWYKAEVVSCKNYLTDREYLKLQKGYQLYSVNKPNLYTETVYQNFELPKYDTFTERDIYSDDELDDLFEIQEQREPDTGYETTEEEDSPEDLEAEDEDNVQDEQLVLDPVQGDIGRRAVVRDLRFMDPGQVLMDVVYEL